MMDVEEFRKRTWYTYDKYTDEQVQSVIMFFDAVCRFFMDKRDKEKREKMQNVEWSSVEKFKC